MLFEQFAFLLDIIMFHQTWYGDSDKGLTLAINNTPVMNRGSSRGGGVALILKQSVACDLLNNFCFTSKECEVLALATNERIFAVFDRLLFDTLGNVFASLELL